MEPLLIRRGCALFLICCYLSGCKVSAPIHLWHPPVLSSTVGSKVVVSELVGDQALVQSIRNQLFEDVPNDPGRRVELVDYQTLKRGAAVQLVSATDQEVNDVALASLARRSGAHFLLRGEVFERRGGNPEDAMQDQLTISWRLTPLVSDRDGGGLPVSVTIDTALKRYPDLALLSATDQILSTAAVRETYRLMMPSVELEGVELESSYGFPGSRELRKGNALAREGRWSEAEQIWKTLYSKNPFQIPALHNLALAAVARQDYSEAKSLASRAIRYHPSSLHQETLAWVETRQRAYHQAFGYEDPPEGWFLTQLPSDSNP